MLCRGEPEKCFIIPISRKFESQIMEKLSFKSLTPKTWSDFEKLFGANGACGGCWCMWWKIKRSEFKAQKGEKNKIAMRAIVDAGEMPGLIAYLDHEPIGWCAVAPRDVYPVLDNSRVLKRVDEKKVWSITCLFITKEFRRKGVSAELLKAAVEFVRKQGGKLVEGYPVEPKSEKMPDAFAWTGLASAYTKAGFKEVIRRSDTRPIMRYEIAAKGNDVDHR